MKFVQTLFVIAAAFTLAACQPTVDASSPDAFESSVKEMSDAIESRSQAREFERSVEKVAEYVALKNMEELQELKRSEHSEFMIDAVDDTIGGMSAEEVIAFADSVQAETAELQKSMMSNMFKNAFGG